MSLLRTSWTYSVLFLSPFVVFLSLFLSIVLILSFTCPSPRAICRFLLISDLQSSLFNYFPVITLSFVSFVSLSLLLVFHPRVKKRTILVNIRCHCHCDRRSRTNLLVACNCNSYILSLCISFLLFFLSFLLIYFLL